MSRILVIGDLIIDKFIYGTVSRISPEASVPILNITRSSTLLGGAGNVARILGALGYDVKLVSMVPPEDYPLVEHLTPERVLLSTISAAAYRVPVKSRFISVFRNGHILRADEEFCPTGLGVEISEKDRDYLLSLVDDAELILVSDYNKGFLDSETIAKIISRARKNSRKVILDSKKKDDAGFAGVYMYKPNRFEFDIITNRVHDPSISLEDAAKNLMNKREIDYLFLTLGEDGCIALGRKMGEVFRCASRSTNIVEVSGAGDSVLAALAIGEAQGRDIGGTATLAMELAAITTSFSPSDIDGLMTAYKAHFSS
jgi:D-beta-D-heptose 7-phosphate kinase / D-beta-D-heptose 1-phosphate adenosyltransferase